MAEPKLTERRFQALVQEGSDLIAILDEKGNYQYVSPTSEFILGIKPEQFVGTNAFDYIHPEDKDWVWQGFSQLADQKRVSLRPFRFADAKGKWRWIQTVVTNLMDDPAVGGIVANSRDITEQFDTEHRVQLSEKRFRALVQNGADLTAVLDENGVFRYVSPSYKTILGYEEEDLLGVDAFIYHHPEDVDEIKEAFERLKSVHRIEAPPFRYRRKDGSWAWQRSIGTNLMDDPAVGGMVINTVDITELVEAQQAAESARQRFEKLVQASADSILDLQLESNVLHVSEGFTRNFGHQVREPEENRKFIQSLVHPDDCDGMIDSFNRAIADPETEERIYRYRLYKADGDYALVEDRLVILRNEEGKAYRTLGTLRDVTLDHMYRRLDDVEREVMTMSMRQDTTLNPVLAFYLLRLEELFPEIRLTLMSVENGRLKDLCSPSVAEGLVDEVNNLEIGPAAASCGTAAHTGEAVVVSDVAADERWQDYRHLAEKYSFKACWSEPIFSSDGSVIATLGAYCERSREPSTLERLALGRAKRLVSIILTRFEYLAEIRKSYERNYYVNRATNDAIYDWDCTKDQLYWGEGFARIFGHKVDSAAVVSVSDWLDLVHPDDRDEVQKGLQSFMAADEEQWSIAYRFQRGDGSYSYVEERGYLIRASDGTPERMIGALRDESVFKVQEIQHRMRRETSRLFTEGMHLPDILRGVLGYLAGLDEFEAAEIWLPNNSYNYLNLVASYAAGEAGEQFFQASQDILQLKKGQGLPGSIWSEGRTLVWDDIGARKTFVRQEAAQRAGLNSALGLPLFHNDELAGVMVLFYRQNISEDDTLTEPYREFGSFLGAEIRRKQQEEEMYLLFHSAPEIMAIASPDGHFSRVNPAFCELLGYTEEELTSQPFEHFIHPDDVVRTLDEYEGNLDGTQATNFINRYLTKSGNYRWISWGSSEPFGQEGNFFAYGRDITQVRELRALLDEANRLARVGGWDWDLRTDELVWSGITREIHEVGDDYIPDVESALNFYKEGDSRETIKEVVEQAIKLGTSFDLELQIVTPRGNERWVRTIGNAEMEKGRCVRLYGSFQDIHAQKSAQMDLDRKNHYLAAASAITGMFLRSEDWSEVLVDIFALTAETTAMDRICYLQCSQDPDTGELLASQQFEWVREPFKAHQEDERFQNIPMRKADPEICARLVDGERVGGNLSQLKESLFKQSLEDFDTRSVLLLPLIIDNRLYGILSFDDCRSEREWHEDEIWLLDSLTASLAAAIQRYNIQASLEQAFDERNAILESIGDGFAAISEDWTVTYWNQQAEALTGVDRGQIVDRNLWDVFSDAAESPFFRYYDQVLKTGEGVSFEEYYPRLEKWFDISVYPADTGISIFFKDATERKQVESQLRESFERFEKVSEATNDAIWDWDLRADTTYCGAGFRKLFGYDDDTVPRNQSDVGKAVHPDDLERIEKSFHSALDGDDSTWVEEYRFQRADGSYATVVDRGVIIRDEEGEAIRMVGAMQDISERKRHEEAQLRLNRQLRRYAERLEKTNHELEQFAYIASHDLQEPLRMVSSFLGLLRVRYGEQLDDTAQEYIDFAVDGATRMRQIILDLLAYSRVGKYSGVTEKIPVGKLVQEICGLYEDSIRDKQARVECVTEMPVLDGYLSPVQQIFQNLIGNALKYSRPGEAPRVTIAAVPQDDYWHFSIQDNGLGIDPQYFEKIFVIFQRLHAKDEYEGTGIGLSVVKKTVEQFGGKIWIESEIGKGSVFHFTLPAVVKPKAEE